MATYTATLKYYKLWDVTVEAESLDEAQVLANDIARKEDATTDINEREGILLVEVTSSEEDEE